MTTFCTVDIGKVGERCRRGQILSNSTELGRYFSKAVALINEVGVSVALPATVGNRVGEVPTLPLVVLDALEKEGGRVPVLAAVQLLGQFLYKLPTRLPGRNRGVRDCIVWNRCGEDF